MSQELLPTAEVEKGQDSESDRSSPPKRSKLGRRIALGLVLGVVCGLLFGDYCGSLKVFGQAYVGLLQMTVLPYLLLSLVSKMGRLDPAQAKKLGLATVSVLLAFWVLAILLIVAVSLALP